MYLVTCNNTKENFLWKPEKINVKFHKNCEYAGKILTISCVRCHFVKFDIWGPCFCFFFWLFCKAVLHRLLNTGLLKNVQFCN